ncbi:PREDICTED: uncharacterized protein C7orf73 homolog [Chaetura pelagica]|uniref:uncharacterized protein C7orf73 homolog n=1 Tax=Chaetura pelagica TaxID=8897 RepID=UPI000523C371|nr:PREDICTED: uncharacterized protein C7orf73 homolog [Chaetura pelagica]
MGNEEKFCPMEVLGGLRPDNDATFGDQPAHSRKGRHSSHCLMEYPLHMDGIEAVAATLLGFTLGNVVGMYLAQNYDIPNIAKKLEEFKKDVEAKKKPPSDKS